MMQEQVQQPDQEKWDRLRSRFDQIKSDYGEDLPGVNHLEEMAQLIHEGDLLLMGGTGSGKSTISSRLLVEMQDAGLLPQGKIWYSEPKIAPALGLYKYTESKFGQDQGKVGLLVGKAHGITTNENAGLLFGTAGMFEHYIEKSKDSALEVQEKLSRLSADDPKREELKAEYKRQHLLSDVSVVAVDEWHERTYQGDELLAEVEMVNRRRRAWNTENPNDQVPLVKRIVASATVPEKDLARLPEYLSNNGESKVNTLEIQKGRQYEIKENYLDEKEIEDNYMTEVQVGHRKEKIFDWKRATADKVLSILKAPSQSIQEDGPDGKKVTKSVKDNNDILVFAPGKAAIADIAETIEELAKIHGIEDIEVVEFHGEVPKEETEDILSGSKTGKRRIIVATDILESGQTIAKLGHVVDSGLGKMLESNDGMDMLVMKRLSKERCTQRKGRVGRIKPTEGTINTYTYIGTRRQFEGYGINKETGQEVLENRNYSAVESTSATRLLLDLKSKGHTVEEFPLYEKPTPERIAASTLELQKLGAFDENGNITEVGRKMSKIPLEPNLSRMVVAAMESAKETGKGLKEVLDVVSVIASGEVFRSKVLSKDYKDDPRAKIKEGADFKKRVDIIFRDPKKKVSRGKAEAWALEEIQRERVKQYYTNDIEMVADLMRQIRDISPNPNDPERRKFFEDRKLNRLTFDRGIKQANVLRGMIMDRFGEEINDAVWNKDVLPPKRHQNTDESQRKDWQNVQDSILRGMITHLYHYDHYYINELSPDGGERLYIGLDKTTQKDARRVFARGHRVADSSVLGFGQPEENIPAKLIPELNSKNMTYLATDSLFMPNPDGTVRMFGLSVGLTLEDLGRILPESMKKYELAPGYSIEYDPTQDAVVADVVEVYAPNPSVKLSKTEKRPVDTSVSGYAQEKFIDALVAGNLPTIDEDPINAGKREFVEKIRNNVQGFNELNSIRARLGSGEANAANYLHEGKKIPTSLLSYYDEIIGKSTSIEQLWQLHLEGKLNIEDFSVRNFISEEKEAQLRTDYPDTYSYNLPNGQKVSFEIEYRPGIKVRRFASGRQEEALIIRFNASELRNFKNPQELFPMYKFPDNRHGDKDPESKSTSEADIQISMSLEGIVTEELKAFNSEYFDQSKSITVSHRGTASSDPTTIKTILDKVRKELEGGELNMPYIEVGMSRFNSGRMDIPFGKDAAGQASGLVISDENAVQVATFLNPFSHTYLPDLGVRKVGFYHLRTTKNLSTHELNVLNERDALKGFLQDSSSVEAMTAGLEAYLTALHNNDELEEDAYNNLIDNVMLPFKNRIARLGYDKAYIPETFSGFTERIYSQIADGYDTFRKINKEPYSDGKNNRFLEMYEKLREGEIQLYKIFHPDNSDISYQRILSNGDEYRDIAMRIGEIELVGMDISEKGQLAQSLFKRMQLLSQLDLSKVKNSKDSELITELKTEWFDTFLNNGSSRFSSNKKSGSAALSLAYSNLDQIDAILSAQGFDLSEMAVEKTDADRGKFNSLFNYIQTNYNRIRKIKNYSSYTSGDEEMDEIIEVIENGSSVKESDIAFYIAKMTEYINGHEELDMKDVKFGSTETESGEVQVDYRYYLDRIEKIIRDNRLERSDSLSRQVKGYLALSQDGRANMSPDKLKAILDAMKQTDNREIKAILDEVPKPESIVKATEKPENESEISINTLTRILDYLRSKIDNFYIVDHLEGESFRYAILSNEDKAKLTPDQLKKIYDSFKDHSLEMFNIDIEAGLGNTESKTQAEEVNLWDFLDISQDDEATKKKKIEMIAQHLFDLKDERKANGDVGEMWEKLHIRSLLPIVNDARGNGLDYEANYQDLLDVLEDSEISDRQLDKLAQKLSEQFDKTINLEEGDGESDFVDPKTIILSHDVDEIYKQYLRLAERAYNLPDRDTDERIKGLLGFTRSIHNDSEGMLNIYGYNFAINALIGILPTLEQKNIVKAIEETKGELPAVEREQVVRLKTAADYVKNSLLLSDEELKYNDGWFISNSAFKQLLIDKGFNIPENGVPSYLKNLFRILKNEVSSLDYLKSENDKLEESIKSHPDIGPEFIMRIGSAEERQELAQQNPQIYREFIMKNPTEFTDERSDMQVRDSIIEMINQIQQKSEDSFKGRYFGVMFSRLRDINTFILDNEPDSIEALREWERVVWEEIGKVDKVESVLNLIDQVVSLDDSRPGYDLAFERATEIDEQLLDDEKDDLERLLEWKGQLEALIAA